MHLLVRLASILIITICAVTQLHSQPYFNNYNVVDGLSNNAVHDLLKTSDGRIWLATTEGLNVFDGYEFRTFKKSPQNPNSLIGNFVRSIAEDQSGNLWIATRQGLSRFHLATESFTNYVHHSTDLNSLPNNDLSSVYVDKDNAIWVGTWGAGVAKLKADSNAFTRYDKATSALPSNYISTISQRNNGNMLFGFSTVPYNFEDGDGLVEYQLGVGLINHWNQAQQHFKNNKVSTVLEDQHGRIWVGTYMDGVYRIDESEVVHIPLVDANNQAVSELRPMDIEQDNDGSIWVATLKSGVYRIHPSGKVENFTHHVDQANSLSSSRTVSLLLNDSTVVIGTWNAGIDIINRQSMLFKWQTYDNKIDNSLPNSHITSLTEDDNGNLWIAAWNSGLVFWDKQNNQYHTYANFPGTDIELAKHSVSQVHLANAQQLWITTAFNGLFLYNLQSKQIKHYDESQLGHKNITAVKSDGLGSIWVGTRGAGVVMIDQNSLKITNRFQHDSQNPSSISHDQINFGGIYIDSKHNVWLSTFADGLNLYSPENQQFMRFSAPTLSTGNISTMTEVDNDRYLIATANGLDLVSYQQGKMEHIQRWHNNQSNTSLAASKLLYTADNSVWFSHSKGISNLSLASGEIRQYGYREGVSPVGFINDAGLLTKDGELIFSGLSSFVKFNPDTIISSGNSFPLVFTYLLINNQEILPGQTNTLTQAINYTDKLTFNHLHTSFEIGFAALDYSDPVNTQYQYKLIGFDKQWLTLSHRQRAIHYTNLNPGEYLLQVRARLKNGNWSNHLKSVAVTILPAPWLSPLAYTLYALTILSVITAFVYQIWQRQQNKIRHLVEVKQQRQQLKTILWGSGDEFWEWDYSQQKVNYFRASLEQIELESVENFSIASFEKWVHPDDWSQVLLSLKLHLDGKSEFFHASYRRKKGDHYYWVDSKGKLVPDTDQLIITGTTKDISKTKEIENQLRDLSLFLERKVSERTEQLNAKSVELEQSNDDLKKSLRALKQSQSMTIEREKMAALGNLVVGVSHEINTPLGASVTATSLIVKQVEQLQEAILQQQLTRNHLNHSLEKVAESGNLLSRSLNRASSLVQRFKEVAADKNTDTAINFNLRDLLDNVIWATLSSRSTNTVDFNIDVPQHLFLNCFPNVFSQVFNQLIDNAIEHNKEDSDHLLITISAYQLDSGWGIEFIDNGKGIEQALREHIFEPFYTTQRSSGKVGLGLHVLYNQVTHKLNGNIKLIDSEQGTHSVLVIPDNGASH